jgi:predicted ATPase
MEDFELFKFETTGKDERELIFEFKYKEKSIELNFALLSDGEKIFFLAAVLLAIISKDKNILCFWDEPDGFISLLELSNFITSCRKAFENSKTGSQLIVTSHKTKTINEFSSHNIIVFSRDSHVSPTRIKRANEFIYFSPTFEEAYENGELI